MEKTRLNIQVLAEFGDILTEHADAFAGDATIGETFTGLSTKLKDLGYDVLLNKREAAEFVPAHRLSETVAQREQYKAQVEAANVELTKLKGQSGMSSEAQEQLSNLIATNENLLQELESAKVQMEVMSLATDAINPRDILGFIDKNKIKLDKKGNILSGAKEEVDRIRSEKPYLFAGKQQPKNAKGGADGAGAQGSTDKLDMNKAIRRAAFGGSRSVT